MYVWNSQPGRTGTYTISGGRAGSPTSTKSGTPPYSPTLARSWDCILRTMPYLMYRSAPNVISSFWMYQGFSSAYPPGPAADESGVGKMVCPVRVLYCTLTWTSSPPWTTHTSIVR